MRYPLVDGQGNFGSVDGDPRGGDALHGGAPDGDRRRDAGRHRQGDRRLRRQLRRHAEAADGPAGQAARTCSSTARPASPSAWPRTSRRTTWARSSTRRSPSSTTPTLTVRRPVRRTSTGPDFPTGGTIFRFETAAQPDHRRVARRSTRSARCTPTAAAGSSCAPRSPSRRPAGDRMAIIVTELPYQVNKAALLEKIAELVKDKKIEGIADLRDESDRDGMRIVHRDQARRQPAQGAEQPVQAHRRCSSRST